VKYFVSTRRVFQRGDAGWDGYVAWIELPHLFEIRTLDAKLNQYVDRSGDVYCDRADIESVLETLPRPSGRGEHYLLAAKVDSDEWAESFDSFEFLGCDLSDETSTSSVLNCGPWRGSLQPFVARLNRNGLLPVGDARQVQKILPGEWGVDEPHARADIWALFGRSVDGN
jgi:hypothetical protein